LEYQHPDHLHYLYEKPLEVYRSTYPVIEYIYSFLRKKGILPLCVFTPSGIHIDFTVNKSSGTFKRLASLGYVNRSTLEKCRAVYKDDIKREKPVPEEDQKAYYGIGILLEAVSAEAMLKMGQRSVLDLNFMDSFINFSRTPTGILSFDISLYGDPVYMRVMRCAGSLHQKNWINPGKYGTRGAFGKKVLRTVVADRFEPERIIDMMSDISNNDWLKDTSGKIPDCTNGIANLIDWYMWWKGRKYHQQFFREAEAVDTALCSPVDGVRDTGNKPGEEEDYYEGLPELPDYLTPVFKSPYPHALRPTNVENLVKFMFERDVPPGLIVKFLYKALAGIKYTQTKDSNTNWDKYDPFLRAMTYVRVYWTKYKLGR